MSLLIFDKKNTNVECHTESKAFKDAKQEDLHKDPASTVPASTVCKERAHQMHHVQQTNQSGSGPPNASNRRFEKPHDRTDFQILSRANSTECAK